MAIDEDASASELPALEAAKMLGGLIAGCRGQDIHRKLLADPEDASAKQWMIQLAKTWSSRVRDNTRSIRRILDLLDTGASPGRR